jgi:hypothetical protein
VAEVKRAAAAMAALGGGGRLKEWEFRLMGVVPNAKTAGQGSYERCTALGSSAFGIPANYELPTGDRMAAALRVSQAAAAAAERRRAVTLRRAATVRLFDDDGPLDASPADAAAVPPLAASPHGGLSMTKGPALQGVGPAVKPKGRAVHPAVRVPTLRTECPAASLAHPAAHDDGEVSVGEVAPLSPGA